MRFFITRHGQPDIKEDSAYPPGDPKLTNLGKRQAKKLGAHLRDIGFDGKILSSPYYRAAQTANIIAQQLDTHFYPEIIIREVADPVAMAKLEPMNQQQLIANFENAHKDSKLSFPWWQQNVTKRENTEQIIARVKPLLDKLATKDEDILLVSHSGVKTRCILTLLALDETQLQQLALEKDKPTNWNCALTVIEAKSLSRELITLRSVEHLPDELITNNKRTRQEQNKIIK